MERAELDLLIDGYTDGTLDSALLACLNAQLQEDPVARRRFWKRQRLHAQLTVAYRAAVGSAQARGPRGASAQWEPVAARGISVSRMRIIARVAAVIAIFIVAGAAWRFMSNSPSEATIAGNSGHIERRGARIELADDRPRALSDGDLLVADESALALRYVDGTAVELSTGGILRFSSNGGGKSLRLDEGTLIASVAKQPVGQPMRFVTPQAEAVVIGTRLTLSHANDATRLEVTEGSVQLNRGEADSVRVDAGQFSVARPDAELVARSLTALHSPEPVPAGGDVIFSFDFEDGVQSDLWTSGKVVEGPPRPGNRHCIAGTPPADQPFAKVKADAGAGNHLFTVVPGLVLSFDYWVDDDVHSIDLFGWNETRQGSSGDSFITPLQHKTWTHATVAVDTLQGGAGVHNGDQFLNLVIQTGQKTGAMFIDNITLTRAPGEKSVR